MGKRDEPSTGREESKYHPQPTLSLDRVRELCVKALEGGSVRITAHFKKKIVERGFDTVDAERIIKGGSVECHEFDLANQRWNYRFKGRYDGGDLTIIASLDVNEDLSEKPLLILITGF